MLKTKFYCIIRITGGGVSLAVDYQIGESFRRGNEDEDSKVVYYLDAELGVLRQLQILNSLL
ncbi:MAG: hypothetical protein ABR503_10830 [Chitinophagaceae bacterium]